MTLFWVYSALLVMNVVTITKRGPDFLLVSGAAMQSLAFLLHARTLWREAKARGL